jgi:hypothetical protein
MGRTGIVQQPYPGWRCLLENNKSGLAHAEQVPYAPRKERSLSLSRIVTFSEMQMQMWCDKAGEVWVFEVPAALCMRPVGGLKPACIESSCKPRQAVLNATTIIHLKS